MALTDTLQRALPFSFGAKHRPAADAHTDERAESAEPDWQTIPRPGRRESFSDYLPWMEYCPKARTILLEDGRSVGAVWEIEPIGTEGRTLEYKADLLDRALNIVADTIPELDDHPWVLQAYVNDECHLGEVSERLAAYRFGAAKSSRFSQHVDDMMAAHLEQVSRPGGLFLDAMSNSQWRGKYRRVRFVLYRRLGNVRLSGGVEPDDELNELAAKLELAFSNACIEAKRYTGADFYKWMLFWFNPRPSIAGGDPGRLLEAAPYPGDEELPYGRDFAEMLLDPAGRRSGPRRLLL